ncbi:hypothetical protein GmHk_17G049664 [Glycine max]|nr:hypothetical protein GmHk_17G049664 [Glycine max]
MPRKGKQLVVYPCKTLWRALNIFHNHNPHVPQRLKTLMTMAGMGKWRDLVAQVVPPMMERETIIVMVDTLSILYYEKMTNEKTGANKEGEDEGETHAVTAIPVWPNFPPTQQYLYSANNKLSPYPPPSYPQRPSLNLPQSLSTALPMMNTTFSTNQKRQPRTRKPVEFTPIPVSYADLLPYLLDNSMVAITLAKVHQPPFLREYDSNATCACHGEAPGRSIEHGRALKRKVQARSLLNQGKFDRCFTRPSTFFIQIYICLAFVFIPAFPNSLLRFTKSFQTLCFSMATSPKETSASGSPAVPSSPHQEQPEFNIQPIQIIPGQASVPEKLIPRRQQGVKIAENPSPATSPRKVDTEMDKKIRGIVSSILKDASVPDAEKDVPTSSNPNDSVPDVKKDVPTSSAPNAEALPSPSEEESSKEEDQASEETPAPQAPEPAPGDLIDLEEVESDEEPIANRLAPGIAERLQSRKGKTPIKRSGRIKTMAQKKSTPVTPATSRRSKVAIPSKKRKEISSSESDDDVELDVSTSKRAKKSGRKVPGNVPDAPLDNISFHSIGNVEKWKYVYQRRLALERELGRDAMDCKEIVDLIKAAGLLKTVSKLGDCYEGLVREFIVNIPSDISNRKSDDYQRVFVRGKCVRFSPAVINKYLGRPTDGVIDIDVSEHQIAKEITAKRVQHWPKKGKLSAGKLSVKYAILHRIGAANWVPTNHTSTVATGLGKFLYAVGTKSKFNFGNYIFDQTVKHSESFAIKLPIAFPTVLCGIMLSQHPNMLNYTDSVMKRESPLSLHYKLFEGTHVPDIVSTSGKAAASGAVSKDALIAELKDACKVLEATIKANTEKKMELERLIKRLSESGIDVEEEAAEEEEEAAEEEEEAAEEEEDAAEETESDDDSEATP